MNKQGCYNCQERYVGCHITCSKYKHYRKQLEELKEKKENDKQRYPKRRFVKSPF